MERGTLGVGGWGKREAAVSHITYFRSDVPSFFAIFYWWHAQTHHNTQHGRRYAREKSESLGAILRLTTTIPNEIIITFQSTNKGHFWVYFPIICDYSFNFSVHEATYKTLLCAKDPSIFRICWSPLNLRQKLQIWRNSQGTRYEIGLCPRREEPPIRNSGIPELTWEGTEFIFIDFPSFLSFHN